MSIATVKILRTISKIVLLVVGIGIIGYGGLMIYKSVVNKPQRVRITNVTDSAATITWVTDNPVRGVVYYRDEGTFLPGPFGLIGSKVAYDDRDFARAQDECVKAFNENAKNTKDANFTVDGSSFDCENIPVEKLGAYYTHSVTVKNLNDSSTYFFVVGNGIWSWSVDGVSKVTSENDLAVANSFNFKTSQLREEVPTPNIAYGTVYAGVKSVEGYLSESLSKDSLVFAYLTINGVNSQTISAVTNIDGGWTFDKSNFRDTEGNLITDLSKATMMVRAQYEDVEEGRWIEVTEDLYSDTEIDLQGNLVDDLNEVEESRILQKLEMLIGKVYAGAPDRSCGTITNTEKATGNYSCYDNCGPRSVSGCIPGQSEWMAKCDWVSVVNGVQYISNDWVKFGKVADSGFPAVCGCTPGTCEEDCATNTHKTCQPAHYWSGTQAGLCESSKCVTCTNGACENVASGGRKVCKNNAWVTEVGSCSESKCTNDDCVNVANGARKVCKSGDWVTEPGSCPTTPPPPPVYDSCQSGNQEVEHAQCLGTYYCNDGNLSHVVNKCGYTIPTANEEKCTIKPFYYDNGSLHSCMASCEDGKEISLSSEKCISFLGFDPSKVGNDTGYGEDIQIVATEITLPRLSKPQLKKLAENSDIVKEKITEEMEKITSGDWGTFVKYCEALGGSPSLTPGTMENKCNGLSTMNIYFVQKAYAQDSASDGYTVYLPEYGMYSFQLGDYKLTTSTTNGNTYYIFYIETNNKTGFQMPADPDNPKPDEDIMLKSSSAAITYEKVSSAQSYTLVKGINLISFNFIPVSTDLGPLTAKGVIDEATKKGVTIQYISSFDGGRWAKGYTCKSGKCSGNDFNILPGKGYLVYATKGGEMTIPGYKLKTSVPVNISGGWNLVGIHGYTIAYTARTLIDSMNKIDGVTANNVTWWPTSKGMYEGLQVTGEQQYGFDFPISPTNGYFVRISSFKPKDKKCKSLLWNEGGALNGTCGIIK